MGETRIYKRLNDGGGSRHVDLSKWRSRRPKEICVSNRRHDSITLICYSAMHNMLHRPRLLSGYTNKRGMQSLHVRDTIVWKKYKL